MKMKSIKAQLFLGGLLAGLISLILAAVNIYSVNQGTEALATVFEHQVQPVAALHNMDRDLKEIRFRMAGVVLDLMPTVGSKNQLKEARDNVPQEWARFKEKTQGNAFSGEIREQIEKIDKQLALLPPFLDRLDSAYSSDDKNTVAKMLGDEWPAFQGGLLKPIGKLMAAQEASVRETYEQTRASGKKLIFMGLGVFAISIIVLMISVGFLSSNLHRGIQGLKDTLAKVAEGDLNATVPFKRNDELGEMALSLDDTTAHLKSIVEGVKQAADKAALSSANLSHQLEQVISRGHTRNERVTHVAAAMEEISVANTEVAHSASSTGEAVHRNEEYARQGDANMAKNRAVMEKVVATANDSANTVGKLNESIQKIGQITTVIKEIADQTNLLALNAAIEAARAGEQGRGFAVVADEVRKLAERTSSSTTEISGVVDSIRAETEAAVSSMSEVEREVQEGAEYSRLTGDALKQIVESANQVSSMVGHIINSTKEQSSATEEVARNMEDISALTEENAANIAQVGHAAEEVSHIAAELQQLVGKFRV